jgi:integrase
VFGDDEWDLSVIERRASASPKVLNFDTLPSAAWKLTAKEYAYTRLNVRKGKLKVAAPATMHCEFFAFRIVAIAAVEVLGAQSPAEVQSGELEALWTAARTQTSSNTIAQGVIRVLQRLHLFRDHLTSGGLQFLAWRGRSARSVAKSHDQPQPSPENRTPRIPEVAMGPYLRGALWFVQERADAILKDLEASTSRSADPGTPRNQLERIKAWTDRRRAAGLGLPRVSDRYPWLSQRRQQAEQGEPLALLNTVRAAREAAVDQRTFKDLVPEHRALLAQTLDDLGWDDGEAELPRPVWAAPDRGPPPLVRLRAWAARIREEGGAVPVMPAWYPMPSRESYGVPDGHLAQRATLTTIAEQAGFYTQAWYVKTAARPQLWKELVELVDTVGTEEVTVGWSREEGFTAFGELALLVVSCYVVVAYLTGMRDSEVQDLRRGCLRRAPSADGVTQRWYLASRIYKGHGVAGKNAEWVAIDPVAQAVRVLERIADIREAPRDAYLFQSVSGGSGTIGNQINEQLNRLREELNRLADQGAEVTRIPDVGGGPWNFTTRQFRRTLAWHIANQPFGMVALMLQYKHVRIQVSEGYAGTSESGFMDEVEAEKALRAEDDLLSAFEDWQQGVRPTGPKAAELEVFFQQVKDRIAPSGANVVDESMIRTLLRDVSRTLHPGLFNWCFYDPARALCQIQIPIEKRKAPILAGCDPVDCPNSCFRKEHLPFITERIQDGEKWLNRRRSLDLVQISALERSQEKWKRIRDEVEAE